jgi:hypothetical protein
MKIKGARSVLDTFDNSAREVRSWLETLPDKSLFWGFPLAKARKILRETL